MTTLSGAVLASALWLSLPADASAQLRRLELGAAADYLGWSSMLPPPSGSGSDRVAFHSQWTLGATLSTWLGRTVGLRANAVYAQSSLIRSGDPYYDTSPMESFIHRDVRVLSASADLVLRLLGSKSRRLLFLVPVYPYLALGGGVTWIDPVPGESCDDYPSGLCGVVFPADTSLYVLDRRAVPTGLVAIGFDVPLHRSLGLRAELGNRVMRSPISRLARAANGDVTRGERVNRIVHGPYARFGVRLFPAAERLAPPRGGVRPAPPPVALVPPVASAEPPDPASGASAPLEAKTVAADPPARPTGPSLARPEADSVMTLLDIGARVDTIAPETVWTTSAGSVATGAAATSAVSGATGSEGSNGDYDVVLDVPNVSVDEITLEVDNLHAHVSLDAKVAKLVSLNVGADAGIDRVFLGIRGVQAEAYLKVDLDNVTKIVDRVLTTIDRNPQIISGLLATLETTVQTAGSVANTALQPGGVVSQAITTVGDVANTALQPGGVVSQAVETVGDVATTTLQPGGVASQVVGAVGGTLENLTSQGGLLSAEGVNALGQTVARTVDGTGRILERTLDQAGTLVGEQVLGNVLQLPILGQTVTPTGQILRTVQDFSGAIIEVTLDAANTVLGTRVLQQAAPPVGHTQAPEPPAPTALLASGPSASASPPGVSAVQAMQESQGTELLLVAVGVRPDGNILQRVVDPAGTLLERVIDPLSGRVLSKTPVGNVLRLGLVNQRVDSVGNLIRVVQDVSGGLVELTMNQAGVLTRMRALKLGSATASAPVSNATPSGVPAGGVTNSSAGSIISAPVEEAEEVISAADSLPTLLLGQYLNDRGRLVQRFVDVRGNITERYLNAAGQLIVKKRAANARRLPVLREYSTATGQFVRVVRDDLGALLELAFGRDGKLAQVRVLAREAPAAVPPVTPVTPVSPLVSAATTPPAASLTAPAAGVVVVIAQTTNALGQVVQRIVDTGGKIIERTLDVSGNAISQREAGSLLQLRVMSQIPQGDGRLLLIARDVTGALLEIVLGTDRRVVSVRKVGA